MAGRFLIVTWDGGGNVQPAIGLGRLLAARGHAVRILGQRHLRRRVESAGCAFRSLPPQLEWDRAKGRAWEDKTQADYRQTLFAGMPVVDGMLAELDREPADVLIVDAFLRTGLCAAERSGLPTAALLHVRYGFLPRVGDVTWDVDPVNHVRQRLGLAPVALEDALLRHTLLRRCDRALAVIPREFEDFGGPLPANLYYVGPIFEADDGAWPQDLPRPPASVPLVVVGFSTTYMYHENLFERILTALVPLEVHVMATLGGGLDPHDVSVPTGVSVHQYIPHPAVFPYASLVVSHAGMGTVMATFAAGVPILCIPLGRDQHGNAERVAALGAGRTLSADASVEEIRAAAVDVLRAEATRAGARRLAEVVAGYGQGRRAVAELEALLRPAPSAPAAAHADLHEDPAS